MKVAQKILVISLGGIGDLLLSTPALRALKLLYPEAALSVMVIPRAYELVRDLPYIDEAPVFHLNIKGFLKNLRALSSLRKKRFDLAINMRALRSKKSAFKMKLLLKIINPKVKVGWDTMGRGYFFDIKIPDFDVADKPETDYAVDTVTALGGHVTDRSIDFMIDDKSYDNVNRMLFEKGVDKRDILIGLHPGGRPSRRWPIENFAKIINLISEKTNCSFAVTGDREDASLAKTLIKIADREPINFCGKLSLKELGALIKRCDAYICNDTGSMHIAAVLKTPLVAIFGSLYVKRYNPCYVSDKAVVFYKGADCSFCDRSKCKSLKCLKAIQAEEVAECAIDIIKNGLKKR